MSHMNICKKGFVTPIKKVYISSNTILVSIYATSKHILQILIVKKRVRRYMCITLLLRAWK